MKPGQIRSLYLEPRLHKQSVKQEINNHGTSCLAKPLQTNGNCLKAMTSISKKKKCDSIFVTDCLLTSVQHHQNPLPVLNFDFFNLPTMI
jgi:hypothetical protein